MEFTHVDDFELCLEGPKQWYPLGVRVVHMRSDRCHTQRCKTDHSYPDVQKGQSWICQTRVFVGVWSDQSTTLWVSLIIHIYTSSVVQLYCHPYNPQGDVCRLSL
jgi:hypothetical protein